MGTSRSEQGRFRCSPEPEPQEAAAVIAAIQQFLRDTTLAAGAAAAQPAALRPWKRAALAEGVARRPDSPTPWA